METFQQFEQNLLWLMPVLIIFIIWEVVWKLIALWKASRNNHIAWFICIALINTLGVLPIIYILKHKKDSSA
jgi:uncharacterized membrane protein